MTTKLPTEDRPIQLDQVISEQVELLLGPYSGEKLERAQKAVLTVYHSDFLGGYSEVVERYREAIREAVV